MADLHTFHIPVMGTGFTIDTPLRVAKLGITSVVSLCDDRLIERVRRHHLEQRGLPYQPIRARDPDCRARRITAYLDFLHDTVTAQMAELRAMPFEPGNDKWRYFSLLPDTALEKAVFRRLPKLQGAERAEVEAALNASMKAGGIDCNIMTKVDRAADDREGAPLGPEHTDAKSALRGFANSKVDGALVLSAGVNPQLFGYLEEFPAMYRDDRGVVRKPIIVKVSDVRSALIQGKYLAKKGLEVAEFRIESGLNCGGHVFPTDGELLGPILEQFAQERERFPSIFEPLIESYLAARGRTMHASARGRRVALSVQGGVGNAAEMQRLIERYGADRVGWASPFLLVPEVTLLDEGTRKQLADAKEDDLYTSDASPLGVRFNNLRGSSSQRWSEARIAAGTPGSPCPKGILALNSEFPGEPLCTASAEYQKLKLAQPGANAEKILAKQCICDHLGNSALHGLGIAKQPLPVSVCPGPNLAYFDRTYALEEMVDHIYGRGPSLVPASRPHMFAKELQLYVEHLEQLFRDANDPKTRRAAEGFRENLVAGLRYYQRLASERPLPGENLESLRRAVEVQLARWSTPVAQAIGA